MERQNETSSHALQGLDGTINKVRATRYLKKIERTMFLNNSSVVLIVFPFLFIYLFIFLFVQSCFHVKEML